MKAFIYTCIYANIKIRILLRSFIGAKIEDESNVSSYKPLLSSLIDVHLYICAYI
jgi:hypothetical protein